LAATIHVTAGAAKSLKSAMGETHKDPEARFDSAPQSVEDLDLSALTWNEGNASSAWGETSITVGGAPFALAYERENEPERVGYVNEKFFVSPEGTALHKRDDKKNAAQALLWFRVKYWNTESLKSIVAQTAIFRNDKASKFAKSKLPPSTGIQLYTKLLDYIATMTTRVGKPIKHEVTRLPGTPEREMSVDKWDEVFVPLLQSRGYAEKRPGQWEYTYAPKQK
jgi:hypothetical protein